MTTSDPHAFTLICARHRWRPAGPALLLFLSMTMPLTLPAQTLGNNTGAAGPVVSQPASTRYTAPPGLTPSHPNQQQYQRYRQPYQDIQRDSAAIQRHTRNDSIDRDIRRQRIQLDADRQTVEAQRALTHDPVESEHLRQDFEQRQQSFERWQRDLERTRPIVDAAPEPGS